MSVDDSLQDILERLGRAVSRAMADSDAAAKVVDRVRREGFSLYLVLESQENESGGRGVRLVTASDAERGEPDDGREARPRRRQRPPGRATYRLNQNDVDLLKSMGIDPSRTGRSKR